MADWKELIYRSYVSSGHVEDRGKAVQDHLRSRCAYFEAIIRDHFPSDRTSRVLDIGCGHGALLYFLQEAGYENARGFDGSKEQVELSHRLGIKGVELADAESFLACCEPGSLDVICLIDLLEHFTRDEVFELLLQVRRVLSANGICIGHVPNAEAIFGSRIRYGDLTHEQAFTSSSIRQLFGSLHFAEVRCFEDKPAIHGLKSIVRRVLWEVGTMPFRLLFLAEAGTAGAILSQNLLFVAHHDASRDGESQEPGACKSS